MQIVRLCLLSMLAVSFFANAQPLYKWVDKSGKVHYSDQPPPKEIKKVDQPRLGGFPDMRGKGRQAFDQCMKILRIERQQL